MKQIFLKLNEMLKPFALWGIFVFAIVYSEIILRAFVGESFLNVGLIYIALFSLPLSFLLFGFCKLFSEKLCRIFSVSISSIIFLAYASQMVYYRIFKTFYTFYSFTQGGKALGFADTVFTAILNCWLPILLLGLPLVLMVFAVIKFPIFGQEHKMAICGAVGAVAFHLAAMGVLCLGSQSLMSPYDLYFRTTSINQSVNKLGLWTMTRLDVQRYFFGTPESTATIVGETSSDEIVDVVTPSVEYDYNVMDIDFEVLVSEETDKTVQNMHRYFASQQATEQNEMTGIFEGCNLVLITAESFAPYAIDPVLTPTLYKIASEGFRFTNYYHPSWGVSTSDGEYVNLLSLAPKTGVWSMHLSHDNLLPFSLGNQFKSLGYSTFAYHNHTYDYYKRNLSHPNLGYDVYKGLGNGLNVTPTWPESDLQMIELTTSDFIGDEPFCAYYMTVSGHMNYTYLGNSIASKNRELVEDLPMSEACQAYLACNIELDRALEVLLSDLKKAGVLENTVIAIVPDHYPYALETENISAFLGHEVEENYELYKSCFLLYKAGMESVTVDKLCSNFDVLPTLSNMFGLEYDSRLMMGKDIFSSASPLVFFENRSWITDKAMYNPNTGEVISLTGEEITQDYIDRINATVTNKFNYSKLVLEKDYYRKVFE